jgi:hypothetical protein
MYRDEKPDLVDTKEKTYFEMKPVTWANSGMRQGTLAAQMGKYDAALGPLGYDRGNSSDLTFGLRTMPLGLVKDGKDWYLVTLWPVLTPRLSPSGIDGRGVLWYELDPIKRKRDFEDRQRIPLPRGLNVPQELVRQIELFVAPDVGPQGLQQDWWFYTAVVASYLAVQYSLSALAAWSTTTVAAGNTLSFETHTTVSTLTSTIGGGLAA